MHRLVAAFLAVSSCASIAQAQTVAPAATSPPLTLKRALALAGETAPSIEAASAGVRAAEAGRTVAGYRPNPTIIAETENIVGNGQYRGLRSAETTAGLALPIELGGKRSARIAVAEALGGRARLAATIVDADLRLAITQAYVEAIAAERRLVTAREQVDIAREALRAGSVRVRAGRASPIEEQRADVLRINADVAVERADRLAQVARDNLARRIGQPITAPLDLAWFDRVKGYGPTLGIEPAGTLAFDPVHRLDLGRSGRGDRHRAMGVAADLGATSDTINVLLEGVPGGIKLPELRAAIAGVPGVAGVHDLHVWSMTNDEINCTAHVTLNDQAEPDAVRKAVTTTLDSRFGIEHSTIRPFDHSTIRPFDHSTEGAAAECQDHGHLHP